MEVKRYSIPILLTVWNLISFLNCEEAWNHTEFKYPDIEAEREHNRLLGVAVSVGLCMIFVFMFCISFTYYKLKEHIHHKLEEPRVIIKEEPHATIKEDTHVTKTEGPFVIIKESTSICRNKQASPSEQHSEENMESVTQITRF